MAPLRQADSIERTAQVCPPSHSDEERHIARAEPSARGGQTPGQTRPVKAISRRSRARKARALTGVGWCGSASSAAHCTDPLSAKENPDTCNVRRCQKSCDKSLHCLTTDRGAPCAFYLAIKRSMSRPSPVLRNSSKSCEEEKIGKEHHRSRFRAGFVLSMCWLFSERHALLRRSRRTFGAAAASPVICNSGAGRRDQIDGPIRDNWSLKVLCIGGGHPESAACRAFSESQQLKSCQRSRHCA